VVAGDARIICSYSNPEGFDDYTAEIKARLDIMNPRKPKSIQEEEEDEEDGMLHLGHAIVAIDQSAITGESWLSTST
jgi:H+-transporting ATPase